MKHLEQMTKNRELTWITIVILTCFFITLGLNQKLSKSFFTLPIPNDVRIISLKMDAQERYIAGLVRSKSEEQYVVIWQLPQKEMIYTTYRKTRLVRALTWIGQRLVYIASEGIRYLYELDVPGPPEVIKVFIFDLIKNQESSINIPLSRFISPDLIESCGTDTIILFSIVQGYPGVYKLEWYSLSNATKIKENIFDLKSIYGFRAEGARPVYFSPDCRRFWAIVYHPGPHAAHTGYLPMPVPVLVLFEDGKEKMVMEARKEWLLGRGIVRILNEETIATITMNYYGNFYLVHLSPQKELWRKLLDLRKLETKGFKAIDFLWIEEDGRSVLCQDIQRRLFSWNIVNDQIKIIATNIKNLELFQIKHNKIWLKEKFNNEFLQID